MHSEPAESRSIESLLRKDKALLIAALAAITLLAWAYLFYLAQGMSGMDDMGEMAMSGANIGVGFGPVSILLLFLMWAVMMVGMMVPSVSPMVLAFAGINRRRRHQGGPYVPTMVFLSGYLLVWVGFAAAATAAQVGLSFGLLLTPMMSSASPVLGAILLLAAGAFQLSPLKSVCLLHCRTPMGFITNDWREGHAGALRMGLHHGSYCLGCCWALMCLLFLLGVMNLLWIAALAVIVLVEKVAPAGNWLARLLGLAFLAWGGWLLVRMALG